MTDDEILQLASETSGAHYMDHAHVIRFARAVIGKATVAEPTHRYIAMYQRCRNARDKLREVMRQALEALRDAHAYSVTHEEIESGVLDVIAALRAELGERDE